MAKVKNIAKSRKSKKGVSEKSSTKSEYNPKVLIVDHGSDYTKHLKDMYQNHQEIIYDVTVKTDEAIRKLKDSDKSGKALKGYDIIHPSGSRNKKNLNDEATGYILDNADKDTHILTTCYSAQVLANKEGADVGRLKDYQKGKQEIEIHGRGRKQKAYIHKEHQWAIPVNKKSESKLEAIATSEKEFEDGKKTRIYEIFRSKSNPRHIGIQGHGEQGVGKDLMYSILNQIHAKGYKSKKAA